MKHQYDQLHEKFKAEKLTAGAAVRKLEEHLEIVGNLERERHNQSAIIQNLKSELEDKQRQEKN